MTIDSLRKNALKKPIVLIRLNAEEYESLLSARKGMTEFTLARQHSILEGIKAPCIVLIFAEHELGGTDAYVGAITYRSAITTLDTRINIKRVGAVDVESESQLAESIDSKRLRGFFERKAKIESSTVLLSPALSAEILNVLWKSEKNVQSLTRLATLLEKNAPKFGTFRLQQDAIYSALKIFGLDADTVAEAVVLKEERDTTLTGVRIREDAVIEHDARQVPGFTMTESFVTGRAYFENRDSRLEIITANKRPLEEVLGVDLIYINRMLSNVVMVQYKMLEQEGSGENSRWIYRPDSQLEAELDRMRKFLIDDSDEASSFRLNSQTFYMKFVKRDSGQSSASATVPLDHFEVILASPDHRGKRGGVLVDYEGLSGRYLRNKTFIDLVRSGYIGSKDAQLDAWVKLIDTIIDGDRAVVAAIQSSAGKHTGVKDDGT